jgi:hypothetical protein
VKKASVFILCAVIFPGTALSWGIWQKGWFLDPVFSGYLSAVTGWRIECRGTRVHQWPEIHMTGFTAGRQRGQPDLTAGKTTLRLPHLLFLAHGQRQFSFGLEDVRLGARDLQKYFSWFPAIDHQGLIIEKASGVLIKRDEVLTFHIKECVIDSLVGRGGIRLKSGRLEKFHIGARLPTEILRGIPSIILKRFVTLDTATARLIFSGHSLRLMGPGGTLLEAEWRN